MSMSRNRSVYVIGAPDGPQKIGVSDNPEARRINLQGANHSALVVHFVARPDPGVTAIAVERMAHWLLRDKRLTGEWFGVTPEEAKAAILTAMENLRVGFQIPKAEKPQQPRRGNAPRGGWHNLATRITAEEMTSLETYRDGHGLTSLNGAVRHWLRGLERGAATALANHDPSCALHDSEFGACSCEIDERVKK